MAELMGELYGQDVTWGGGGQGGGDEDGVLCDGAPQLSVGMVFCKAITPSACEFSEGVVVSSAKVGAEVSWTTSLFPFPFLSLDLSRVLDLCPSRLHPGVCWA